MKIDTFLFDSLTSQAQASPRLRMNYDLRTTPEDSSQRMLNALEPGTVLPIHRHTATTETVAVLRGSVRQNFYDNDGRLTESFVCEAGGTCCGYVVEVGRWHNTESLQSGTIILESKDGKFVPISPDDILE